ncbi:hypothetical protein TNCV_3449371 [Trichonephila clavipes]|nr:hypothetical protein TNCV_3449371 [Trichonephila clavipes]
MRVQHYPSKYKDASAIKAIDFPDVCKMMQRFRYDRSGDLASQFVVDHTTEDAPVIDAESGVATVLVSELRVYADANVVKLSVQTLVVLPVIPVMELGFGIFTFAELVHSPGGGITF